VIQALYRRLRDGRRDEEGFTLIELMVVVMIIAILVAIAIPSFFSARKRAQDSSAKSSLQISLTDAQAVYTDSQAYPSDLLTQLNAEEPNITHQAAASTGPKVVSVVTGLAAGTTASAADQIMIAARSQSQKCFLLRHVATPGISGLSGTYVVNAQVGTAAGEVASCVASATAGYPTGVTWVQQ
jgi:type IV pilus assembly protein PilA